MRVTVGRLCCQDQDSYVKMQAKMTLSLHQPSNRLNDIGLIKCKFLLHGIHNEKIRGLCGL